MIFCVDVGYQANDVVSACVGIHAWTDSKPATEAILRTAGPPPAYQPGVFYRRELPYLLPLVVPLTEMPQVIVIDGYVWLAPGHPGLGVHLHAALGGEVPIVGVAKRHFHGTDAIPVLRGVSKQPLFVTAIGLDVAIAAEAVRAMHGPNRIPAVLKHVDRLSRG